MATNSGEGNLISLAVLLVALAVLVQAGAAVYRGHQEEQLLRDAIKNQTEGLAASEKVRKQLNAVLGKTLALSREGNANAARIIEQMEAAGINVNPNAKVPAQEAPAP